MKKILGKIIILLVLVPFTISSLAAAAQATSPLPPDLCSGVTEIPNSECQALAELYNSTNGSAWTDHTDWLATTTPCSWYGVTCSAGHVQQIFLGTNGLSGSLPTSLNHLAELEALNLGENALMGAIPPELGNMTNLQELYLNSNQLTGSIPPELGNLSSLQRMNLGSNQLTGAIPPQWVSLVNLEWLNLENNHLTGGLPAGLGSLTNLQFLNIAKNQLSGPVPGWIGNLTDLEALDISNNAFAGEVPVEIKQLTNLKVLETQFDYNVLSASDASVRAFMTSKDPNWIINQTVPPASLLAFPSPQGAALTWTPIPYISDGGYYEISYSTILTGTYTIKGITADKTSVFYNVSGLAPNTVYYFRLRTFTPRHDVQQNDLWSGYVYSNATKTYLKLFLPLVMRLP